MMSPECCCCSQVCHCPCLVQKTGSVSALCARALIDCQQRLLVEDLCRTRPLFVWAHRLHSPTCTSCCCWDFNHTYMLKLETDFEVPQVTGPAVDINGFPTFPFNNPVS